VSAGRIVLREFGDAQPISVDAAGAEEIAAAAASWKAALKLKRPPLAVERAGRRWQLRAEGVAGVVRAGGVTVEIVPKFLSRLPRNGVEWRRALWRVLLLIEGHRESTFEPLDARAGVAWSLPDLMAREFLHSLDRGSARGLPSEYMPVDAALPVLRGRLDAAAWGRLGMRPWELPCRFDELSADNPTNRLLRWAGEQLQTTVASPRLAFRLREAAAIFGPITPRPPTLMHAERLRLGSMHAGLAPALAIAIVLLRNRSLEHGDDRGALDGFLWEGERLFEAFALRIAGRAAASFRLRAEKRRIPVGRPLGSGAPLRTNPDICVHGGAGHVEIVDAKYKRNRGHPKAADVYQVLAAGKVGDSRDVGLVYPLEWGDDRRAHRWEVDGAGSPERLWALGLDLTLMAEPSGEGALVAAFESHLRGVLAAREGDQPAAASTAVPSDAPGPASAESAASPSIA
jgi:5-methylcytosine-specific restriction enzyme subunit McrC